MLLDEEFVAGEVGKRDAVLLAMANECLTIGNTLLSNGKFRVTKGRGITQQVVHVAVGLLVKATRLQRAITLLLQRGLSAEADILLRSLFETMVAVRFVLKPRVNLKESGHPVAKVPGKPLTTHFRACLYLAHQELDLAKAVSGRRDIKRKERERVAERVQIALRTIGPEWEKRLKGSNFAGVHLRALCESLGLARIYAQLYRPLSWSVHGRDATSHAGLDLKNKAFVIRVAATMPRANAFQSCSMLYVMTLAIADDRMGLKLKAKLDDLAGRLSVAASAD